MKAPITSVMRTFDPVTGMQSEADQWCLSLIQSWSLGPVITLVVNVMDELISNALQHGKGQVRVDLQLRGERVWIGVRDEGPGPMRSDDGTFPPLGHANGLGRVAKAPHFWGVKRHDGHGSTVWSELDITN
jgi:anti-sigma regulatory factor (Ser/Thr protein kinase)